MSKRRRYQFFGTRTPPQAICDRCGLETYHTSLVEQMDFRGGDAPVGTGILVCNECNDVPQQYYARPIIKQDPYPVRNPRPEPSDLEPPLWILSGGFWNDTGVWIDTDQWVD